MRTFTSTSIHLSRDDSPTINGNDIAFIAVTEEVTLFFRNRAHLEEWVALLQTGMEEIRQAEREKQPEPTLEQLKDLVEKECSRT